MCDCGEFLEKLRDLVGNQKGGKLGIRVTDFKFFDRLSLQVAVAIINYFGVNEV